LKVLHIVRQFSPSVGGLEASVQSLASAQRSRFGIDARVVTLDRLFGRSGRLPAQDIVDGIPVRRLPWRGSTRYPLAPSVLAHLQAADVLHVHAIDFFFDFLAATRPLHGRPMIASTHGGFFHSGQYNAAKKVWFNSVTWASIRAYRRIVACSYSDADMFRRSAGARLTVIENGINQVKFRDASSRTPTRTIISFGRFAQHKRIGHLFPLLARLRSADPAWRLIVAGREADQTAEELRSLAGSAGVSDAVRFVIDPSDDELRALMGEASYFGCLSAYEGFGLAAVEAMSAGLLPILSGITPFRRLVESTGIGLIVDAENSERAAPMIQAGALSDAEEHLQDRLRAMHATRHYDWEEVASRYVVVYREAIGSPSLQHIASKAGASG
jgi:alpha-1,3-mannosyltransferase